MTPRPAQRKPRAAEEAEAALRRKAREQAHTPRTVPDPEGPRGDEALERDARTYAERFTRDLPRAGRALSAAGDPLSEPLRREHEARLGVDLGRLRLSDDAAARQDAGRLGAHAVQDGNEIRLGPRAPRDEPGRIRLVAHEVAHFAQTQSGRATPVPQLDRDLTLTPEVPAPEITRTPLGVSVTVYFSQGSFLLGASGYQAIERLRTELALMPDAVVRIDGFASAEGAEDFNMRLSEHRRLLIHRLLLSGLTFRPDVTGQAFGETLADESGVSGPERETFRSRQRRVDISIVSPAMVRAAATEPSTPAVTPDLRLRLEFRPETPEERLNRMLSTRITPRPPATFSVCGRWREETRTWFDRRLRDIGVGGPARGILTDLGVGAVERLPFMLIEEGLSAGGVTGTEQRAIMTTIRAACQQEWQP